MKRLLRFRIWQVPVILLLVATVLWGSLAAFAIYFHLNESKTITGTVTVTQPGGNPGNPLEAKLYEDAACITPAGDIAFGQTEVGGSPVTRYLYFRPSEINPDTLNGTITNNSPSIADLAWSKGSDDGAGHTNTLAITMSPLSAGTINASVSFEGSGGS